MVRRRPPIKSTQPSQLIKGLTKGNGNSHSPPAQLSKTIKEPNKNSKNKGTSNNGTRAGMLHARQARGPNGGANGNGILTSKQARFVEEYLVDLNATQAAIRAGYSKKTAHVIGIENFGKPKIAEAIQKRRDELQAKTEMDQNWVLERYKRLVDYDLSDFFDDDGNLKPLSEIPQQALYAVTGFKNIKTRIIDQKANGGVKEIHTLLQDLKLTDKKTALDSIGKHLGMFAEDNAQRRPVVPIQINVTLTDE